MPTTIPYLERLEADLELVAEDAAAGRKAVPGQGGRRRRPAQGAWMRWSGAAAALLVVAWGIGSLSGQSEMALTASEHEAGSTVAGGGEATSAPRAGAPDALGVSPDLADEEAALGTARDGSPYAADIAKIDRDGTLSLKLEEGEFKPAFNEVVLIADRNGGVLLASETHGPDSGTLTLRIPAVNFDRAFAAVSQLGAVRDSTVTGKDVTAEYLDLRAHLRIAKGRRDVIFGLYDRATTISDTLRIYDELEQVQLRIEQTQGRLNYLDQQTSISTLEVTLSEREPEPAAQQQGSGVENPSLTRAWERAVQGFLGVIATVIVGLGYLVPLGILVGIGLLVFMLVRRRGPAAS
ncbi:MAG: DUF4349 domain-containing protein [Actinomycetota bacterium]